MPPSAVPSASAIQTFCEQVYTGVEDGWLVLSYPDPTAPRPDGTPAMKSDWFDVARTPWQALASAAARRSRTSNVYFGVVLQQPNCEPGQFRRSRSATAYSVPGLWFDLDLAYGHHAASQLPMTDREALEFLADLPARPSLIVHSGGGLYGYWLFREQYVITTEDAHEAIAHFSRQFTHTIVEAGKLRGWTLDALGDLARVLRPPGTINHKYGKLVEIIHEGHERYNLADFDWLEPLPAPARAQHQGTSIAGQPDLVTIAAYYGPSLERKSATELAGMHPQHGSSTGLNFNVNLTKGLWHCWRHGTGGDALALIAVRSLEGNPAQRPFLAAPLQLDLAELATSGDVFGTDLLNRIGRQPQVFGGASGQRVQVIGRQKGLVSAKGQQTHFVTIVPDIVDRRRHLKKMCSRGLIFYSVLVREC